MGAAKHETDPKKLPVPWKAPAVRDLDHQQKEWASGTRGGGRAPADLRWPGSPKQHQEEYGSGGFDRPVKG